jgi:protein O-mannosyl-transferase
MAILPRLGSSSKPSATVSKWPARAALAVIALAAYADSFGLGMALDANVVIKQDPRLRAVTTDNLKLILSKNYWWPLGGDGLYRPVTTLSFLFNYAVLGSGPNGTGYHVANVLLHAINVWLLYELALAIFGRAGPAFFAAALWAVHPIGTEVVASITGRADLLAAMAVLGGLLVYIRGHGGWTPMALFAISLAGVFSKENAAVLIGLMLLWEVSFGKGKAGVVQRWRSYAAVGASLVVLATVRHLVLGNLAPYNPIYVDNPLRLAGFWAARWSAIKFVGLGLGLLLFPVTLLCDHSYDALTIASASDGRAWLSLLAIVAILALVVLRYGKDRVALWAAGFFAITLIPTSNFLFLIGAGFAERFLYLPAIAFAIMIPALLYRMKNDQIAQGVLIVLIVVYAGRTIVRNLDWDDDLSLASADLPNSQRSFRLHYMLAQALYQQDEAGNIDRAIAEEEAACMILAPLPPARSITFPPTYLGIYYASKAQLVNPGERTAWLEKSRTALLKAREISQALEKDYDKIQLAHGRLMVRDCDAQLYLSLGSTCMKLGRYQEAVDALRYAQGVNPGALELYDGLSQAYSAMGDLPRAVVAMEEKGLVDHFQLPTMQAMHDLYQKVPAGRCAFVQRGAGWQLNMAGCPRVKDDFCGAYAALAQAYGDARISQGVTWAQNAEREHVCQADTDSTGK